MSSPSRVERLGTEKIGKLLLEMSSQTTLSLLVYAAAGRDPARRLVSMRYTLLKNEGTVLKPGDWLACF